MTPPPETSATWTGAGSDSEFGALPQQPLKTLVAFYRGEYTRLAWSMVVYVVKASPYWALPLFTANVIDIAANPERHSITELWVNIGLLIVLQLQNIPSHYLYVRLISSSIRRVEKRVRSALFRQMQDLSMTYYAGASGGALQTKALRDAEVLEQLARQVFQEVPGVILTMITVVIVTAFRAPIFLVWFAVAVPLAIALVAMAKRRMTGDNVVFREAVEDLSASVAEMIRMIPVARAHGVEAASLARVEVQLNEVQRAGLRLDATNGLFGGTTWVVFQSFNSLCLLVGGWAAYTHRFGIGVGDVVLFSGYFATLAMAAQSLLNQLPLIGKGLESVRSIREVLESPHVEHNEGKKRVTTVVGRLQLEHVTFVYGDSAAGVHELTLDIEAGQTVAFVGPSGAGKSTLLNLLLGFIRPTSGRILLDGVDMATLDLRSYRRFVATVPQETLLFDGTLRDNILYGVDDADPARFEHALTTARIREFLDDLPAGLDTRVGEHGARLSGGQRQRIAIARALVREPRVLLLDEATSALDSASERHVRDALAALMDGRTSLVVTHRLGTVSDADQIVVLDQGRIVETGTHAQLLGGNGLYARLSQ
ncbi:MAG: ABC transporter ATP-binding protein [Mycobacteriales bacterium]